MYFKGQFSEKGQGKIIGGHMIQKGPEHVTRYRSGRGNRGR
jgi:hypothetical protein